MAVNFPNNPSLNDVFVFQGKTFSWDGTKWVNITSLDLSGKYVGEILDLNSSDTYKFWIGTQSEYDSIPSKSNDTIYFIEEEV